MSRSPLHVAALIAAALALSGCSTDRDVLARVGSTVITVPDFDAVAAGSAGRYPGPPDSAKVQLLDDLVTRALLIEEAKRRGLAADPGALRARSALEDRLIVEALLEQLAPADVAVSEAEVRAFHAWRGSESHLFVIYTTTRDLAEGARLEIARGVPFRDVADRYNLRGLLPEGGDLGWIVPGSITPPLDDAVREAEEGVLQGPLRAPGEGWFLALVTERRPRDAGGYEEQRAVFHDMVRQRKQRAKRQDALESLRDDYRLRLERGAAQVLFQRAQAGFGGATPPPLTDAERAVTLARYEDARGVAHAYTVRDADEDLSRGEDRPDFSMIAILQQWIETQALRRIAVLEARRRHLQDDPAIARRIDQSFHNQLVDELYTQEVIGPVTITPADVRAEYDRMPDQFSRLDWAQIAWVEVADSADAAAIAEQAGRGPFPAVPGARDERVRYPSDSPRWNLLAATVTGTAAGGVMGPYPLDGRWFVAQVVDKQQTRQPFERLESAFVNMLETNALERKREARLREWTGGLRAQIQPEVHPERLARTTWPGTIGG